MSARRFERSLPAEEAGLWARAMRDVTPLPGRRARRFHPPPRVEPPRPQLASVDPPHVDPPPRLGPIEPHLAAPLRAGEPAPQPLEALTGLDRASAERLRRGRRDIEARLDLHGMTQGEAHQAVQRFVESSQALGRRCVLVITGRGSFGGGVLKQAVPRWLAEPGLRRYVLAIAPAQPRHGGAGALYLLLKRLRAEPD